MQNLIKRLLSLLLAAALLAGGSAALAAWAASAPAGATNTRMPEASGQKLQRSGNAEIDYSNTQDGYVMVRYTASTATRIKAQVKGPGTTYTYDVSPGRWETFPLSDGNGSYRVAVLENVVDNKYATLVTAEFSLQLGDELAPYLRPNQYVDYAAAPNAVAKAGELTQGIPQTLEKVRVIYNYVVDTLTYDEQLAASVKSGYLPVLDTVLAKKKGICFDYAALMTGMLRSQGVPCKLVVGYAGGQYHAWVSVWSAETGWIEKVVYFDGKTWQRMDPTFASSSKRDPSVMKYIGDGKNYSEKYIY